MVYKTTAAPAGNAPAAGAAPDTRPREHPDPITTLAINVYPGGLLNLAGSRLPIGDAGQLITISQDYGDVPSLLAFLEEILDVDVTVAAELNPHPPTLDDPSQLTD